MRLVLLVEDHAASAAMSRPLSEGASALCAELAVLPLQRGFPH